MLISVPAGYRLLTDGRIIDDSPRFVPSGCAQPPTFTWHYFDAAGAQQPLVVKHIDNCAAAQPPMTYRMVTL